LPCQSFRAFPSCVHVIQEHGIKQAKDCFRSNQSSFVTNRKIDQDRRGQFGLVAEDVEKINSDLVVRDQEGKAYSVRYDQVNAMLLNEFLKEHRKVEPLQKQIEALLQA